MLSSIAFSLRSSKPKELSRRPSVRDILRTGRSMGE
jgi:hypothetical protein